MKEGLIAVLVVIFVGTSGLALAHMMGTGGSCCSSHQFCPTHQHQMN